MTFFDYKKFFSLVALLFFSFSSSGQSNWLWGAGSSGNDEALSNAIDLNGNIYTTGYFSLFARFDSILLVSSGGGDVFVLKQNSAGDILWAVKAGGNGSDRGTSIATDNAGNIYVCGYFSGTAMFGSIQLVSSNNTQDIFVAKLDASGNFLWAERFGGDNVDLALALAVDNSYNVVVTGQFKGSAIFGSTVLSSTVNPANFAPSFDIFLLKVDSAGNFLWVKHGAAKYDDRGLAIATYISPASFLIHFSFPIYIPTPGIMLASFSRPIHPARTFGSNNLSHRMSRPTALRCMEMLFMLREIFLDSLISRTLRP